MRGMVGLSDARDMLGVGVCITCESLLMLGCVLQLTVVELVEATEFSVTLKIISCSKY